MSRLFYVLRKSNCGDVDVDVVVVVGGWPANTRHIQFSTIVTFSQY
jgi:hypothetical protein